MSTILVCVVYGFSAALALACVYLFHARWYWHVLSVLAALIVGFSPPISGWENSSRDLIYGAVVVFLLMWGLAEPFLHRHHRHENTGAFHHV